MAGATANYIATIYILISLCSFCLIMKMVAELLSASVETETKFVIDHDKDEGLSALLLWQDVVISQTSGYFQLVLCKNRQYECHYHDLLTH